MARRETTVLSGALSEYLWSLKDGYGLETASYAEEGAPRPADPRVAGVFEPDETGWIDVETVRARLREALAAAAGDDGFRATLQKRKGTASARSEEDVLLIGQVVWNLRSSAEDGPRLVLPPPRDGMRIPAYLNRGPDLAAMSRDQRFRYEDSRDAKSRGRGCHPEVGGGDALKENGKKLANRMAAFLAQQYPQTAAPRAELARFLLRMAGADAGGGRPVAPDHGPLGVEGRLGDVLLDASVLDYAGVELSQVVTVDSGDLEDWPEQPAIIREARSRIPPPEPNHQKAHLVGWQAPVQDQGNIVVLDIARSDFWTSLATRDRIAELQTGLEAGALDLGALPRRLDVHLVVVAGLDDSILLTRRGAHLATEPSTWMVTVGESMDWNRDGAGGTPHPSLTARRCLEDLDELHLPRELVASARYTLVALATEWNEMLANLIVLAELPELGVDAARAAFRRGENVALDAIGFSVEAALPLVETGEYAPRGRQAAQRVSDISRIALLAALRHRFGADAV